MEVAGVEPAVVAAAEREVRWRARAFLAKRQKYLSDPHHHGESVVFLQVSFEDSPSRWPSLAYGDMAAPPTAPRRSVGELVALALEDLGG